MRARRRSPAERIGFVALALALALGLSVASASAGGREMDLGLAGKLWLPVPAHWQVRVQERVGPFPTWELSPPDSRGSALLVTPTWGLASQLVPLRAAVAQEARSCAEEMGIAEPEKFLQVGPEATLGWYAAEDPRSKEDPEDYAHLLRAVVDVGELRLNASLFHHEPDEELRQAALWLLANARHEREAVATDEKRLRLGSREWALVLPVAGFRLEPPRFRADLAGIALVGEQPETGLVVSAFLEVTEEERSAAQWRDDQRRRLAESPLPVKRAFTGELHGHPALQYDVPLVEGQRVDQRHVHAYLAIDDCWVDVHLSKVDFRESEAALFTDFLAGLRVEREELVGAPAR